MNIFLFIFAFLLFAYGNEHGRISILFEMTFLKKVRRESSMNPKGQPQSVKEYSIFGGTLFFGLHCLILKNL